VVAQPASNSARLQAPATLRESFEWVAIEALLETCIVLTAV
jgi:hypothetical protein